MAKKHKNQSKATRVYAFGAYPSVENSELVDDIFYRAWRFRNDLIRVELDYRKRRDEIVREYSLKVRNLEAEHQCLTQEIADREGEVNTQSIQDRKRCLAPELKGLRKQLKQTEYALVKEQRAEERRLKQYYSSLTNERLEGLQQQMTAAKSPATKGKLNKAIRAERESIWQEAGINADMMVAEYEASDRNATLDTESGLLWPTKNTIKADVARAIKDGPRIRGYDGGGRIGGQPSTKGISVAEALAGTSNWLRITGPHEKCTRGHHNRLNTAWIRIDSEGRNPVWAVIPFVMHRPLPADAHITNVYLVRNRVASKFKYEVHFVLAAESWVKDDLAAEGECAIDLNWRWMDGSLRVASWGGMDGEEGDLFLPAKVVRMFEQVNEIKSIRDREFNIVRDRLAAWIKSHEVPEWLQERGKFLSRWRSQRKLAKLVLYWRDRRFDGDDEIFAALDGTAERVQFHGKRDKAAWNGWRNWDKHLYEWERNLHQKAIRCRQAIYRDFAAELTRRYHNIVMEDINWHEIGKRAEVGEADNPTVRAKKPIGAVGELAQYIIQRAACPEVVEPQNTTRRCPVCRTIGKSGPALYHECKHCGRVWDQDKKAWLNMLLAGERLDARLTKKKRDSLRKAHREERAA